MAGRTQGRLTGGDAALKLVLLVAATAPEGHTRLKLAFVAAPPDSEEGLEQPFTAPNSKWRTLMVVIAVVGGTGYAGSAIVREARAREHDVVSLSRTLPELAQQVAGVDYRVGSVLDEHVLSRATAGAAVILSGLSPRGELDGKIVEVEYQLAALAAGSGSRFGVVGGSGSLRLSPGGPPIAETDQIPPEAKAEASQMLAVLRSLESFPEELDWFFVSPAIQFGAWLPSQQRGTYRIGGDVVLFDKEGNSAIGADDLALAILDEVDKPTHRSTHFSVAY